MEVEQTEQWTSEQNGNKVDLMKAPQQRDKEQGEGGWR